MERAAARAAGKPAGAAPVFAAVRVGEVVDAGPEGPLPEVLAAQLTAGGPVTLRVEALCTWRDQHGDRFAGGGDPRVRTTTDGVVVEDAYRIAGPGWSAGGEWYRDVYLREESARDSHPIEPKRTHRSGHRTEAASCSTHPARDRSSSMRKRRTGSALRRSSWRTAATSFLQAGLRTAAPSCTW